MKLIIGIGNPGEKYKNNRHNVGHMFVDFLRKKNPSIGVVIKKTSVLMNNSGQAVKLLTAKYKLPTSNLYIVHDDLDIPFGQYKIQFGVGPKVHYGVTSIEKELQTKDFWHVRVGVNNRSPEDYISGETYVLQNFTKEEKKILDGVIKQVCKNLTNRLIV